MSYFYRIIEEKNINLGSKYDTIFMIELFLNIKRTLKKLVRKISAPLFKMIKKDKMGAQTLGIHITLC